MSSDEFETDSDCQSNCEPDILTKAVYLCGPQLYSFCQKLGILADVIPSEITDILKEIPENAPIAEIVINNDLSAELNNKTEIITSINNESTTYKISLLVGNIEHEPFDIESEPAKIKIYDAIYMMVNNIMMVYPKLSQKFPLFEKETLTLFNHYNDFDRLIINIAKL